MLRTVAPEVRKRKSDTRQPFTENDGSLRAELLNRLAKLALPVDRKVH
jgi:hypothetical protein